MGDCNSWHLYFLFFSVLLLQLFCLQHIIKLSFSAYYSCQCTNIYQYFQLKKMLCWLIPSITTHLFTTKVLGTHTYTHTFLVNSDIECLWEKNSISLSQSSPLWNTFNISSALIFISTFPSKNTCLLFTDIFRFYCIANKVLNSNVVTLPSQINLDSTFSTFQRYSSNPHSYCILE